MMYDSWDMEHNRQIFFSFWTIFCPFTPPPPLTTQRIKVLKKWLYTILFLRYGVWWMQLLLFILGNFLPFHTPNCPKTKISKKRKKNNARIYHHFTQVYQKSWSYTILFMRYGTWHMWFLFFILSHFLHFYSLTAQKMKTSRKWKKLLEIPSF